MANVLLTLINWLLKPKCMLKHCFLVYKKHYDFLALRHLAVCTKIFFFFFTKFFFCILEVLTKTGYFNIGFCIFSNIKIPLDINQNDIKNTRENCKIPKIFFNFLLTKKKTGPDLAHPSWDGPDLAHILWAGLNPAAWAGLMFQPKKKQLLVTV